jgi:hypothetical protein
MVTAAEPHIPLGNRSSPGLDVKRLGVAVNLRGPQLALEAGVSSMVMNLTEVSVMGSAVLQLASGSTEPASMSAWGLLLIAIGVLLRVMKFRATRPKAEPAPLEPIRPFASSMPR